MANSMSHKVINIRTHGDRTGIGILSCYWNRGHYTSACPDRLELHNRLQRDLSPAVRLTQFNKRPSTNTHHSSRTESKGKGKGIHKNRMVGTEVRDQQHKRARDSEDDRRANNKSTCIGVRVTQGYQKGRLQITL